MISGNFLKFTGLLEPAVEGGFILKCFELPVATEGETKEEALANLKEAIEGYIEVRAELLGKSKTKMKRELVEITDDLILHAVGAGKSGERKNALKDLERLESIDF